MIDELRNKVHIEEVVSAERLALGLEGNSQATAICLSGGGIRSATFSLGVLQGLAQLGRLRHFHYLSTVSGGGYIGLWLATWISRAKGGAREVEAALAAPVAHGSSLTAGSNEPEAIRRLRAYSNFLSPVHGLSADSVSIVAICARNLTLHWAMVLPIVFAALLLPRIVNALLYESTMLSSAWLWWVASFLFLVAIAFASWDSTRTPTRAPSHKRPPSSQVGALFVAPVVLGALAVSVADLNLSTWSVWSLWPMVPIGALIQMLGEVVGTSSRPERTRRSNYRNTFAPNDLLLLVPVSAITGGVASGLMLIVLHGIHTFVANIEDRTTFGLPLILVSLGIANVVRSGLSMRWTSEDVREWWGRASGVVGIFALAWVALSLLVIQIPMWLLGWASTWSIWTAGLASVGSILLAIGTTVVGFWSKHGSEVKEKANGFVQTLGLRSMEIASFASVSTIALAASLLLGMALTREPFMGSISLTDAEHHEKCAVVINMISSKPDIYCAAAIDACGAEIVATRLPEVCASQSAPMKLAVEKKSRSTGPKESGANAAELERTPSKSSDSISVTTTPASSSVVANNFILRWLVRHRLSLQARAWQFIVIFAIVLLVTSVLASVLFGANAFSLNSFYGNRLTRAYLGASRCKADQHPHPFTGFDRGDNLPLKDIAPVPDDVDGRIRLLPIVNTALNLVRPSGDRLEWQERKAASFFMSPYHCGSDGVGFVPTKSYASRRCGLSVGRAMAISGAAASPSMGYHSSPLVSLLMAFFNVRLGWWMPNPNRRKYWKLDEPLIGIGPIVSEMISTTSNTSPFVYLSDGGHFENLGLYEMVRRRCNRIIVVDAGFDPKYQYEDLEDAVRKIRVDFGIRITFPGGLLRPEIARATDRHCFFGTIHYSERQNELQDGEIVYIKPLLSGDETVDVRRYAESTRSDGRVFPQQPTSDQFFDEAQFESYRELGEHSVLTSFSANIKSWPRAHPTYDALGKSGSTPLSDQNDESLPRWAPTPEATRKGGVFAALASIGPLGQAAMLASVTAAITVTGTVALKNPTVTLSNPEVHFAKNLEPVNVTAKEPLRVIAADPFNIDAGSGITVDIGRSMQSFLSSNDVDIVRERQRFAAELKAQLAGVEVDARLIGFSKTGTFEADMGKFMINANQIATDLGSASSDMRGVAAAFRKQLDETIKSLGGAINSLNGNATELGAKLKGVQDVLNSINTKVQKISPRETVRGSER